MIFVLNSRLHFRLNYLSLKYDRIREQWIVLTCFERSPEGLLQHLRLPQTNTDNRQAQTKSAVQQKLIKKLFAMFKMWVPNVNWTFVHVGFCMYVEKKWLYRSKDVACKGFFLCWECALHKILVIHRPNNDKQHFGMQKRLRSKINEHWCLRCGHWAMPPGNGDTFDNTDRQPEEPEKLRTLANCATCSCVRVFQCSTFVLEMTTKETVTSPPLWFA